MSQRTLLLLYIVQCTWIFQVTRMLVGGFDIIGLFACASPDEWKSAQAKLRQVWFSVCRIYMCTSCSAVIWFCHNCNSHKH